MAILLIKGGHGPVQVLQLKLGLNRFGRSSDNDFQINHPTVSGLHCEITSKDSGLTVRDCDSTNGTFINGEPISEGTLQNGQTLELGDVELFVESTAVQIAIPEFKPPPDITPPPIVVEDGSLLCPIHPTKEATHQCTSCLQVMCPACVVRVSRKGGKVVELCPACSSPVRRLSPEAPQKDSLLQRLAKTIKLPFLYDKREKGSR